MLVTGNKGKESFRKMGVCGKKIRFEKQEFMGSLIVAGAAILMYYPMAINWLVNPDAVWNSMVFRNGHGGEKINGRLAQIAVDKLRMNMVTPLLTTVICALLLGLTAKLICQIYQTDSVFMNILVGGILVFAPCTLSSMTYFYCAESFMLAFFLAVLAVFLIVRWKGKGCCVIAAGLLFISLYLYQAYICIVFALAVTLLVIDMLDADREVKESFLQIARLAAASITATVAYIVSFRLCQALFHIEAASGRGFDTMGKINPGLIPTLVGEAYVNFFQYYFGNRLLNNEFGDRNIINLLVMVSGILVIIFCVLKQKMWNRIVRMLTIIVTVILFPLAFEAITVMTPKVNKYDTTGIIMVPTMALLYCFVLTLGARFGKEAKRGWIACVVVVVCMMFIWNSIVFTNLCINYMQLSRNKADTVANLMLDDITEQYGFQTGQKLLVAGSMEDGNFPQVFEWPYDAIKGTSASFGFMWDTYSGNEACWIEFLRQYHGMQFEACSNEEYQTVLETETYQEMPLFPAKGSVRKIDDMIVVKMSDIVLEN